MPRLLALLFLLPALVLAGCGDSDDDPSERDTSEASFPLTIESDDGQSLTLNAAPERIVSLDSAVTEILCSIGAGEQIAAVEKFENCPSGSNAKPSVDAFQPNLEAIAAYRPDSVFASYNPAGRGESLRRLNIPVLYLEVPTTIAGVYENIALFGQITGHSDAADEPGGVIAGED
jgi:iron complex transport system substrate-binding protein